MNILVYLGHPAQYHFLKNAIRLLQKDGHNIKILIKTKDILEALVKEDGWDYENIQPKIRGNSKFSILIASLRRTVKVLKRASKFKADLLVGEDSSIAQSAWLFGKPSITTLEDDVEIVSNYARLTYPFTKTILTPDVCKVGRWIKKQIPYRGYMKLAYLHPSYFTPDSRVLSKYEIPEKYILVRLALLNAFHDIGISGLNIELVCRIAQIAEERGYKMYISSEYDLDDGLKQYALKIQYSDIHHIMAYASLVVSDSQSMSVESAMLGVPSLRFSDFVGKISVLEELEHKYQLTFGIHTSETEKLKRMVSDMLAQDDIKQVFVQRRQKMLSEKIDVTAFLVWFLEKYPESRELMLKNPGYQLRFR